MALDDIWKDDSGLQLIVAIKKLIKRPLNIRPNELRESTDNQVEHNKLFEDTGFISEDAVELEIDPLPRWISIF